MAAPTPRRARTRTGCKTCRQRKLKCDEVKPICGHCRKSNRECLPSEGVAFRHAQNAGLNDQDGGTELGNFYKYRQKFGNTYFLPVPRELSFIHVTDPYADDLTTTTTNLQPQVQTSPLQHHQHQNSLQQQLQHHNNQTLQQQLQHHVTGQVPPPDPHSHTHSSYQHPQYVDVAATSLKAMIDPNLESGTANSEIHNGGQDSMTAGEMNEAETLNETILNALKQSDAEMGLRVHGQNGSD